MPAQHTVAGADRRAHRHRPQHAGSHAGQTGDRRMTLDRPEGAPGSTLTGASSSTAGRGERAAGRPGRRRAPQPQRRHPRCTGRSHRHIHRQLSWRYLTPQASEDGVGQSRADRCRRFANQAGTARRQYRRRDHQVLIRSAGAEVASVRRGATQPGRLAPAIRIDHRVRLREWRDHAISLPADSSCSTVATWASASRSARTAVAE